MAKMLFDHYLIILTDSTIHSVKSLVKEGALSNGALANNK